MNYLNHHKERNFSFHYRYKSIRFACNGLIQFLKKEHNARVHAVCTVLAIVAAFILKINQTEWLFLAINIGFVWVAELFNTSIEYIMDQFCPTIDTRVKIIKDMAASAVLVAAFSAFITGAIIFIPKL